MLLDKYASKVICLNIKISMKTYIKVVFFLIILIPSLGFGQAIKNGKLYLNEDGSHYVKLTLNTQVWMRAGEYNPGSRKAQRNI